MVLLGCLLDSRSSAEDRRTTLQVAVFIIKHKPFGNRWIESHSSSEAIESTAITDYIEQLNWHWKMNEAPRTLLNGS